MATIATFMINMRMNKRSLHNLHRKIWIVDNKQLELSRASNGAYIFLDSSEGRIVKSFVKRDLGKLNDVKTMTNPEFLEWDF